MCFRICKGPEWKPGIFIQFTKEGGIAREAGLRPGDQILYCNNIDFSDIQFNEVFKSHNIVQLLTNYVIIGSQYNENFAAVGFGGA